MLGRRRRLCLLAEGCFTPLDAKTAVGVLRYRTDQVVAVIDSTRAGRTADACVGVGGGVPVVADLEGAAARGADSLLIGIAPQGGHLPEPWRAMVRAALGRGWDVLSGLHVFLDDEPELASLARASGAMILDVRRPPFEKRVAAGRAAHGRALVVLTVGSDCNVGKMTTALEIDRELAVRGVKTAFVATGQTGIMIAGRGVAVDAVPADFIAGAVEAMVVEAAEAADVVLVEGQGALHHPGYSGVTLGLLHGAAAQALVLCHHATRDRIRVVGGSEEGHVIPPLEEIRAAYEGAAAWVRPARVVGASLNTLGLDTSAAHAECARVERALKIPTTDPVRFGAGRLAEAIMRLCDSRRRPAESRGVS